MSDGPPAPARVLIEFREAGEGDPASIDVLVDLEVVVLKARGSIQSILDGARIAWYGASKVDQLPDTYDGVLFQTNPAMNRRLPARELRVMGQTWVVSAAFRELVELAHGILEDARRVLAAWSMLGIVTGHEFEKRMFQQEVTFHRRGFGRRIEALETEFGFRIDADWRDRVNSWTRLRNCIVHRFGRITNEDTGGKLTFDVEWHEVAFYVGPQGDAAASRRWGKGDIAGPGETVWGRTEIKRKSFPLGGAVDLTLNDLNELAHSTVAFAQHVRDALAKSRPPSIDEPVRQARPDSHLAGS